MQAMILSVSIFAAICFYHRQSIVVWVYYFFAQNSIDEQAENDDNDADTADPIAKETHRLPFGVRRISLGIGDFFGVPFDMLRQYTSPDGDKYGLWPTNATDQKLREEYNAGPKSGKQPNVQQSPVVEKQEREYADNEPAQSIADPCESHVYVTKRMIKEYFGLSDSEISKIVKGQTSPYYLIAAYETQKGQRGNLVSTELLFNNGHKTITALPYFLDQKGQKIKME